MKYIVIMAVILLLALPLSASAKSTWRDLNSSVQEKGLDTPIHLTIGAVSSALVLHYLPKDMNVVLKYAIAITVPTAIGAIKEETDINYCSEDIVDYGIGAVIGVVTYTFTF